MAFVISDIESDLVTFYRRRNFADVDQTTYEYIERGNVDMLRYYIMKYMDTTVKEKRPDTPHKLIMPRYNTDNFSY